MNAPTYEALVEELEIDPEEIAARDPWSFAAAVSRIEG